ncbi:hypothetical protein GQX74_009029 [Glossina fuscipes]|nr:hypothetical protein GQX74_009029 [Glossina fuscipes]
MGRVETIKTPKREKRVDKFLDSIGRLQVIYISREKHKISLNFFLNFYNNLNVFITQSALQLKLALVGGGFAEFCLNSIFVFKILTLTFYHNLVRLSWKKVLKEISTVLKCFSLVDEVV